MFLPLSETCRDPSGEFIFEDEFDHLIILMSVPHPGGSHSTWPGSSDTQVVDLPIVDSVSPRPPYLPPAVPADLVDRIAR